MVGSGSGTPTAGRQTYARPPLLALVLVVLTIAAYHPAVTKEFFWDDETAILREPRIHSATGLWRLWFTTESTDYQPIVNTIRWVQWHIWGVDGRPYHLLNIILHGLCAVVIWRCLTELDVAGAWWAAALFAVHPVTVASVAWVVELKNCISAVFFWLSLLTWLAFDRTGSRRSYALSLVFFVAALLSKGSVVVLPCLMLLCAWWRRREILPSDLVGASPFFFLALGFGILTIFFQEKNAIASGQMPTDSFLPIIARPGWAFFFYLWKGLLPTHLCMIYPKWDLAAWGLAALLPNLILVSVFLSVYRRRASWGRPALMALASFLVLLFPVLGLFRVYFTNFSLVADHWQYLALPVVTATMASFVTAMISPVRTRTTVGITVGLSTILLFAASTWQECTYFRSAEALWRKTIGENPNAAVAYNNLGVILVNRGEFGAGLQNLDKAILLSPDFVEYKLCRANALLAMGQRQAAIGCYEEIIHDCPGVARAYVGKARALMEVGRTRPAIGVLEEAQRLFPKSAQIELELGVALWEMHRVPEAQEHLRRAVVLRADYAEAYFNLGLIALQLNKMQEAVEWLSASVRENPQFALARWKLAEALAASGVTNDALKQFDMAIKCARITGDFRLAERICQRRDEFQAWRSATR